MKKPILLLICLGIAIQSLISQGDTEIYIQVDYMKSTGQQVDDYVSMEQMVYKPIHAERIKAGEIIGWYLYEVQYPSGENTEYNYVTLTIYANFSLMDAGSIPFDEIVAKVHPDKTVEEVSGLRNEYQINGQV